MTLDFKLNYYFEKYKETSISSNEDFKKNFIKENGNFAYLNELVIMINRYQVKKYGTNLCNYVNNYRDAKDKRRENEKARLRNKRRFGTKLEREMRKLNENRT